LKIRNRLVIGFACLIILTGVVGFLSLSQILSLNTNTNQLANTHMVVGEESREMEFHADYMVHMMHHYVEGTTTGTRDSFDSHTADFDASLQILETLVTGNEEELIEIRSHFTSITSLVSNATGIFNIMDSVWDISDEIHEDFPGWLQNIDDLISQEVDIDMILNASALKYNFDYQVHMMHHYIEGTVEGTRQKFANTGINFENCVIALTAGSVNTSLVSDINDAHIIFEALLETADIGLFDLIDQMQANSDQIHIEYPELKGLVIEVITQLDTRIEASIRVAENAVSFALVIIIVLLCITIVLGVGVGLTTIRATIRPINSLVESSDYISKGDLTRDIGEIKENKDELGVLSRSFDVMVNNLRDIISASQDVSVNVSNIATELSASSSEVNAASEEISSSTQEVSSNTQDQVNSLIELNKMANEIQEHSQEVKESSKSINNIMDIITSISEQTNLLALNASIEAGRAGEQGRGFAVVADEVRKLAEESQSAVSETAVKIEEITTRIEKTVELIKIITEDIQRTTMSSQENSKALEGISASSEQQTASMEEISSTANKLGTLAEDLNTTLKQFKIQKEDIKEQVIQK